MYTFLTAFMIPGLNEGIALCPPNVSGICMRWLAVVDLLAAIQGDHFQGSVLRPYRCCST